MLHSLFLSLEGMTDPLGQSQVLPYLRELRRAGHQISLLSCEKPEALAREGAHIRRLCEEAGIHWEYLPYYRRPRGLASLWQVRQLYRKARALHRQQPVDLLHCRSYLPALVGLRMKRKQGIPFLFDMRGFWVDERVEGGLWNLANPLYRLAFRYLKKREKKLLTEAAAIVSLTEKARDLMQGWPLPGLAPIRVIPCSVDLQLFAGREQKRAAARQGLGVRDGQFLLGYLGSLGTWYMLPEMMLFFRLQREKWPEARFLLLTASDPEMVRQAAQEQGLPPEALLVRRARREEVPGYLSACDLGLCFVRPTYAKQASSPTKLGEMLAMGLPVVANAGVGDLDVFFTQHPQAGYLLPQSQEGAMRELIGKLEKKEETSAEDRRELARKAFSLQQAGREYDAIYRQLFEAKES
jgi:glycosyltransferase involved in cell wall biosynthesis